MLFCYGAMKWLMKLAFRPRESPEEARKRRLCRMKLGLPPEIEYVHVWPGLIALGVLSTLLVGLVAWRLDAVAIVAWGPATLVALGALAAGARESMSTIATSPPVSSCWARSSPFWP